jgi:hypothetical protein
MRHRSGGDAERRHRQLVGIRDEELPQRSRTGHVAETGAHGGAVGDRLEPRRVHRKGAEPVVGDVFVGQGAIVNVAGAFGLIGFPGVPAPG